MEAVNERILIVDDDESLCRTLHLILNKRGYDSETALSGEEAIRKASENSYHMALLDIRLPDMQGLELLTQLSKIQSEMDMILITGHASVETALAAVKTKAAAFIVKPIDMEELFNTIEKVLERQHLIHKRKFAEDALRHSEERYRTLVKSLHDNVFVFDQQDRYSEFYYSDEKLLYVPPEEFLGKHITDVLPDDVASQFIKCCDDVRRSGSPQVIDYPLLIEDEPRLVFSHSEPS